MKANQSTDAPAVIDQMDEAIALIRTAYTASFLMDQEQTDAETHEAVLDTLHYGLKRLDAAREAINEAHK